MAASGFRKGNSGNTEKGEMKQPRFFVDSPLIFPYS